jgi:uncharacterized protein YndB with AHSA1/START domain
MNTATIQVNCAIASNLQLVWNAYTKPEHITNWYFASPEWHAPKATNDLKVGGSFFIRMEAKDGSFGFDFEGVYTEVIEFKKIVYVLADERKVITTFEEKENEVTVTQIFNPENENNIELQQAGWQAILDNFKRYALQL